MDDRDAEFAPGVEQDVDDEVDEAEPDETSAASDPAASLQALIVYLASNLTDQPDEVEVTAVHRGQAVHLSLRVPEEELGKVIGRQGRIARAMRTALMIAGSRHQVRATLDIEG